MPDPSTYFVETGYLEPGYFVSEPAPPEVIKYEKLTVYRIIDEIVVLRARDRLVVYEDIETLVSYRPVDRTTVYLAVTEV